MEVLRRQAQRGGIIIVVGFVMVFLGFWFK
jgi:hypothetical protein